MSTQPIWHSLFEHELAQAVAARAAGNEAKARVCARRAAGRLVSEVLLQWGCSPVGTSAYDRLRYFAMQPETPAEVKAAVEHFITHVTPEHLLPVEVDLIAQARWLSERLRGGK